jgi:hypothetical protein
MTKFVLLALSSMMLAISAFAVDGQMLINQSTVMAQGGFPYKITQPGSYKLTGNLTMTTTDAGNVSGFDAAIGIASSQVTLDLNGFSISVVNNIPMLNHNFYAIAELGTYSQTTVRNGNIVLTTTVALSFISVGGIVMFNSTANRIEQITIGGDLLGFFSNFYYSLFLGKDSVVRNVVAVLGNAHISCPSVIVEAIGLGSSYSPPCVSSLLTFN